MSFLDVCMLWILASALGAFTGIGMDLVLSVHDPGKRKLKAEY